MNRYIGRTAIACVLLLLAASVLVFLTSHFEDFDFDERIQEELTFESQGITLSGTLLQLNHQRPVAVAVIIHGDGPQDRYSNSGYNPLFNTLLDANIAVFSWDKAGVGHSQGNWLHQSMANRAEEAVAALKLMQSRYPDIQVGYLGFSQAGWVIPIAAGQSHPVFSVIIGGAVNWRRQGLFFQSLRYAQEGKSTVEIERLLAKEQKENDAIFGENGTKDPQQRIDMTSDRFDFVVKNYLSDSSLDLSNMNGRVLAVWGINDLNVDAQFNACRYKSILSTNPLASVIVLSNASHGLLRSPEFNYQLESDWPVWRQGYFLWSGREAYSPNGLKVIVEWIKNEKPNLVPYDVVCKSGG